MKFHTLSVKRRPVQKGMFHRLSAVTKSRKQRVAVSAMGDDADMDSDESTSKTSRSLLIILLFHVVAIGLVTFHQKYLVDKAPAIGVPPAPVAGPNAAVPPSAVRPVDAPAPAMEQNYTAKVGDTYASIAQAHGIDEAELRRQNAGTVVSPGTALRVSGSAPASVNVVAKPIVTAPVIEPQQELVDAEPVEPTALKPNLVKSSTSKPAVVTKSMPHEAQLPKPQVKGVTYTVQSGDSIYRISNRFKVKQEELMKLNQITDPKKMKIGMKLVIPKP
jgi:LysM repeat protein